MTLERGTFPGTVSLSALHPPPEPVEARGVWVNDVHSQLNPTRVHEIVRTRSGEEVAAAVERAGSAGRAVSICGRRHAMGAQPFGTGTLLLDIRGMTRVRCLDAEAGLVQVEAGSSA